MSQTKRDRIIYISLENPKISFSSVKKYFQDAEKKAIPIIFVSDQDQKTIESIRKSLKNKHPFLTKDTIFIPKNYFKEKIPLAKKKGDYLILSFKDKSKGFAVKILSSIYDNESDIPHITAAIGNSLKDTSLLRSVHIPFLVKQENGKYASLPIPHKKADGVGITGLKKSLEKFINVKF